MSALHELQSRLVADLFAADGCTECAYVRGDGVSAPQRLAIYRGNVFDNYRQALRAVYPVVCRLVGDRFFEGMADEYIRRCPSLTGDLNDYGAALADFLGTFSPARSLPYLADVARLEWLVDQAFHAADHAALDVERLAALPPEQLGELRFRMHPACRLFESAYPVARIWQVNQTQWTGDPAVDLDLGGERLLVHRDGYAVALRPLSAGELAMLTGIAAGRAFGDAYAAASSADAAFDLGVFLRQQIGAGVLVDYEWSASQAGRL